jgi:ribosomal protein L35AE/L33A
VTRKLSVTASLIATVMMLGLPAAASASDLVNDHLRVTQANDSFKFGVGTAAGERLTYNFPSQSSYPGTEIDGVNTQHYGATASSVIGDALVSTKTVGDIEITQRLELVHSPATGREDALLITLEARNSGAAAHQVGLSLRFDTQVSANDGAPVSTSLGYQSVTQDYQAPTIPSSWQAYEVGPAQGAEFLVARGTLAGPGMTPPDRFVVGQLTAVGQVVGNYDADITSYLSSNYGDSGVALIWYAQTLDPGQTRTVTTAYGLGEAAVTPGTLALTVEAPAGLAVEGGVLSPNPFTINVLATNTGSVSAADVALSLQLPAGLTLDAGQAATQTVGSLAASATSQAAWTVSAEGGSAEQTLDFIVNVTSSTGGVDPNQATRSIVIPAVSMPPVVTTTTVLQNTHDTVGPYLIATTVDWKGSTAAAGGGIHLVWRVDGAAPWTRTLMNWTGCAAGCTYDAVIPGQADGSHVEYYVEATNVAGDTGSEPSDAPTTVFTFDIVNDIPPPPPGVVVPTSEFIFAFDSQHGSRVNGHPLSPGDVIDAYDPDGVLCGSLVISVPGEFSAMPVYADDPTSPADEGAESGDEIHFKINGVPAAVTAGGPVVWTGNTDTKDIVLTVGDVLIHTDEFIFVFDTAGGSTVHGLPLAVGDKIEAFDPAGVLCGVLLITAPGQFSAMPVYADDPTSPVDEGADVGDEIHFKINGVPAVVSVGGPVIWSGNADTKDIVLTIGGGGGPTPTDEFIFVFDTVGGSTIHGLSLAVGDKIEAFDPDGVLCGVLTINAPGQFPAMAVYADDPTSPADEGAELGDEIHFKINGVPAVVTAGGPVVWTGNTDTKDIVLTIGAGGGPTPTDQSIFVFDTVGGTTVGGLPLAVGDKIEAFDPAGILCGVLTITTPGQFPAMAVYADDPTSPEDEGAEVGDEIHFKINGVPAVVAAGGPVIWTGNADTKDIVLLIGGGVIPTSESILVFDTVGGTTVNGLPLAVGDVIQAFDPQGILCGVLEITTPGQFPAMPVYADDPTSPEDEGAEVGDEIQFKINGIPAVVTAGGPVIWTGNTDTKDIVLRTPIGGAISPVVSQTTVLPNTEDTVGPYVVQSTVTWEGPQTSDVTELVWRANGSATWNRVVMPWTGSCAGGCSYSAAIPGQAAGTQVEYYVEATDDDGDKGAEPHDAPATVFSFDILSGNPPPVVSQTTVLVNTQDTAGPYVVQSTVTWDGPQASESTELVWRANGSGAWNRVVMPWTGSCAGGCTYSAAIPGQAVGTHVEYYVEAIDEDEDKGREPHDAPATVFSFDILSGNPPPVVSQTTVLVNTPDTVGPYVVQSTVTWDGPQTSELTELVWRANGSGAWNRIVMPWTGSCAGGCTYSAAIPGQAVGTHVEYYVESIDDDGDKGREPSDAPATVFSFDILSGNPPPVVSQTTVLPNTQDTVGPYVVQSTVTWDGPQASESTELVWRANGSGAWNRVVMPWTGSCAGGCTYSAAISGQPVGTHVEYYVEAIDEDGDKGREPGNAPATVFSFDILGGNPPPMVSQTTVLANTEDTVGPYAVQSTVTWDGPQTSDVTELVWRANGSGAWNRVVMPWTGSCAGGCSYSAAIPGQAAGTQVEYYVEATDDAGAKGTEPGNAPVTVFSFDILSGNPPPVVSQTTVLVHTPDTVGPYAVQSTVTWDGPQTSDVTELVWRANGSATWNRVVMPWTGSCAGGCTYSAAIPGQPVGTHVEYYVEAIDDDGDKGREPGNAPVTVFSFDILSGNPPPVVSQTTVLANTHDTAGPYVVQSTVAWDGPQTSELTELVWRANGSGAWNRVVMPWTGSCAGGCTYSAGIPGQATGTHVEYYVESIDDDGDKGREPGNAPATVFSFDILSGNPPPVVSQTTLLLDTQDTVGPYVVHTLVVNANCPTGCDFKAAIPGQAAGTQVDYYVEATDAGGAQGRQPANAPASFFSFSILNGSPVSSALGSSAAQAAAVAGVQATEGTELVWRANGAATWNRVAMAENLPPVVSQTTVLPNTPDTVGPYAVQSTVTWDGPQATDLTELVWRSNGSATWNRVVMPWTGSCAGGCTYSAAIPGQAVGTQVEYYVESTDEDGDKGTEPSNAPATVFLFDILSGNPPPVVSQTTVLPNTQDTVGPYAVQSTVAWDGVQATDLTELVWRVNGSLTWDRITMPWTGSCAGGCTYSAAIPGQAVGTHVEYYVESTDEDGDRGREPSNAPVAVFSFDVQSVTTDVTVSVTYASGWNMISLPVVPADGTFDTVFPGATSTFGFTGGYQLVTQLAACQGYWLNLPAGNTFQITGTAVGPCDVSPSARWNMLGVPFGGTIVDNIVQNPTSNVVSIFAFNGGYQQMSGQDLLVQGGGFWFNLATDGQLILNSAGGGVAKSARERQPFTSRIIATAVDGEQTMRLGVEPEALVALPPVPPAGLFDVRAQVADIETKDIPTTRHQAEYPLSLQGTDLRLTWDIGETDSDHWQLVIDGQVISLAGLGSVDVANAPQDARLRYTPSPSGFALAPAYPNPFNPSTTIQYNLDQDGVASLTVYNLMGQAIRTLVAEHQVAGHHSVTWDARDDGGTPVSAGMYIYRLEADSRRLVQKMVLLK